MPTDAPQPNVTPAPVLLNVVGGSADQDANLEEAAKEAGMIRLRVQTQVMDKFGDYRVMPGVRWILDVPDEASAKAFYGEMDEWVKGWVALRQGHGGPRG